MQLYPLHRFILPVGWDGTKISAQVFTPYPTLLSVNMPVLRHGFRSSDGTGDTGHKPCDIANTLIVERICRVPRGRIVFMRPGEDAEYWHPLHIKGRGIGREIGIFLGCYGKANRYITAFDLPGPGRTGTDPLQVCLILQMPDHIHIQIGRNLALQITTSGQLLGVVCRTQGPQFFSRPGDKVDVAFCPKFTLGLGTGKILSGLQHGGNT